MTRKDNTITKFGEFSFLKFDVLHAILRKNKINISLVHFIVVFLNSDEIYIAPSGVQKERILPEDIFIQGMDGRDIQLPPEYKK